VRPGFLLHAGFAQITGGGVTARALTIAGSDPGGGAGIQADLKTFTAFKVYGAYAITSITVQNTLGVSGAAHVPPQVVAAQMDAVLEDIGADAAKTGMLVCAPLIKMVAARLKEHRVKTLVVDPVIYAKGGRALLEPRAVGTLMKELFPLALIVTPNAPEAEKLSGIKVTGADSSRKAARAIRALGPAFVLIKGGHLDGPVCEDLLYDGREFLVFRSKRVATKNTHGTGCTLSAAIAAGLALGATPRQAVTQAVRYVSGAINNSFALGAGHGPLNHFWRLK
jgi:hydroxymethylpyrimidine/phosphomethylpyrimidine kinase